MKTARLDEVVKFASGGTPPRANGSFYEGDIPWITGADINPDGSIRARSSISEEAVRRSSTQVLPGGTVALVTRTSVGKVGVFNGPTAFSQDITAISPSPDLVTGYLVHFLRTQAAHLSSLARGATIKGVTREVVAGLTVPLPPIAEQQRIAAILDAGDAIRTKHHAILDRLDTLTQEVFRSLFGESASPTRALGDLADITSGVTKGRKTRDPTVDVPYLAVANVQAGALALKSVKTIPATVEEIDKFRLRAGDLVLTEGGDPDKLGRGTVWRDELPLAIHQNHIFRVRIRPDALVRPDFASAYIGSPIGRGYFLRVAKQTTGIATINKGQLSQFPMLVPRLSDQDLFAAQRSAIDEERARIEQALVADEELFASLQSRAFSGRL